MLTRPGSLGTLGRDGPLAKMAVLTRSEEGTGRREMQIVYFKSEDDGDGTYDGQIGHAYLHLDDGSTGDEGRELGFITLAEAARIASEHAAGLDVDGPTRDEWDAAPVRRSFLGRLLGR